MNPISTSAETLKQRDSKFSFTFTQTKTNKFPIPYSNSFSLTGLFVNRYARQVAEFFEFVKQKQETSPGQCNVGDSNQPQVLMPHNGGLWIPPDGNQFPGAALQSLDLRKAMSLMTRSPSSS